MLKKTIVLFLLFGLISNVSFATEVAFVDVQKVVYSSSAVKALKKEQEAKAKELLVFVEKARKDVAATKDEKKKLNLEVKYNKEYLSKREKIEKDYSEKLLNIEKGITKTIEEQAKKLGYDMVIAKGTVLYGGNDITEYIIKAQNSTKKKK